MSDPLYPRLREIVSARSDSWPTSSQEQPASSDAIWWSGCSSSAGQDLRARARQLHGRLRGADRTLARARRGRGRQAHPPGDRRPAQAAAGRRAASSSSELRGQIEHFFHLAAIYDMTAPAERNTRVNVGGTTPRGRAGARAGGRAPTPRLLDRRRRQLPRRLSGGYLRRGPAAALPLSPHQVRVRADRARAADVPWRVYRPAIVVGDSQHRRDGQDRRPLLLLQGDPARCASCCRSGCRWWASTSATPTSCRSIGWRARSTTSRTSPAWTARPST